MKTAFTAGLIALAGFIHAFPQAAYEAAKEDPELAARTAEILEERAGQPSEDNAAKLFEPVKVFNAKKQYIDIGPGSGHQFVAPGPHDARGPCPGLNAFANTHPANHGFLPHNGYATITEFIDATMSTVGMGVGLASFLAIYGAAIDGSGTAWSIGGTPFGVGAKGGNGITNSHNKYESDVSPMRPDLYQFGNDYKVRTQQFQQLIDLGYGVNGIDIPTLTAFRKKRFDIQKANNPFFFNGPFTGVLVQPAAYTFIYRFMANHSAEHKEGYLSRDVIQSWFSITGKSGAYTWVPGHEKIPNNWYRRTMLYPYEQTYFLADVQNAAAVYPEFLDIGGNLGKTGTFTGVDVANLSGGTFNSKNLAKGHNFACFAYQFAANAEPDLLLNNGMTPMGTRISNIIRNLACPKLAAVDDQQLQRFPGYNRSGCTYRKNSQKEGTKKCKAT